MLIFLVDRLQLLLEIDTAINKHRYVTRLRQEHCPFSEDKFYCVRDRKRRKYESLGHYFYTHASRKRTAIEPPKGRAFRRILLYDETALI